MMIEAEARLDHTVTSSCLDSITQTLREIVELPFAYRLKTIQMAAYLRITDTELLSKAITGCLDAGLLTSPTCTFTEDVQSILSEVIDGQ